MKSKIQGYTLIEALLSMFLACFLILLFPSYFMVIKKSMDYEIKVPQRGITYLKMNIAKSGQIEIEEDELRMMIGEQLYSVYFSQNKLIMREGWVVLLDQIIDATFQQVDQCLLLNVIDTQGVETIYELQCK